MNKWMKKLTAALCAAVLMCGMAVTAYAGGGEEWDGLAPVEPLPAETVDPGEGFTEDGNLVTRDLLYDKATNKQFITVQTSGGNTFYIVIDYDKPTEQNYNQIDGIINNLPVPPPEDKPLDKVREHPPKRRSREREER